MDGVPTCSKRALCIRYGGSNILWHFTTVRARISERGFKQYGGVLLLYDKEFDTQFWAV